MKAVNQWRTASRGISFRTAAPHTPPSDRSRTA